MRKIILVLCITAFSFGYSQDEKQVETQIEKQIDFPKNEIKLNALYLVAGAFEVTYEHLLNEESSIGVALFARFDEDSFNTKFSLSPYYRFYFSKKPATGFFVEGFGMLNSYTQPEGSGQLFTSYTGPEKDFTDFALGFGIGGKWVTRKGFVFEINAGVGRNLFNSNDTDFEIVGRGGISVGYRFK